MRMDKDGRSPMERQIVCFQIPTFEIALARLQNTSLRSRPVAIAPTHTPRACLHEVSLEAHDDGLRPGMSVDLARRFCPSLRLISPNPLRVRHAHDRIQAIVARYAPVWEPVQPGHVFLDLTGTGRLFGPAIETASRIDREMTHQHGLTGVIGVASNKLVSRVAAATLLQPPQCCDVRPGLERTFLAPLPISLLPGLSRAVARKTLALLNDLNLHTLGQIAEIPLPELEMVLGRPATLLHRWAHGIDPSPVLPPVQHSRLELSRRVEPDEVDDAKLLGVLRELGDGLCRQLRRQQQTCRRLTLVIGYGDHVHAAQSYVFQFDTCWEADLYPRLKELFFRSFQRRIRLRTLTISAEVAERKEPGEQLSLFDRAPTQDDPARIRAHRLAAVLDRVRERFGDHSVRWGRTHVLYEGTRR
ncbi:MAG: DNA polymerase Y family protein [Nitrospiraceae bacterium]